jgi:hypothetical protein
MRAFQLVLLAATAFGGAAAAQDIGNAANTEAETRDIAAIHFDLRASVAPKAESLPEATTLGELTFANESPPAAAPTTTPAASLKPAPRPVRKTVARRTIVTEAPQSPPMSAWRRAYIARHGHEPPAAK